MITPAQRAEIRRLYYGEHWKLGTIAAQLGLHRETVRAAVEHESGSVRGGVCRPTALDPYLPFIRDTLAQYPRLRATRIHEMVHQRGYPGSVIQVRRLVRRLRPESTRTVYRRVVTLIGEQAQVDWGSFGKVRIGHGTRAVSGFVMVLGYSRAIAALFTLDQTLESFLRGHVEAFDALGGTARTLVYDNLRSAVLDRRGAAVQFHPRLLELAGHYHFAPRPCTPGRGNEKGKIERQIQYLRHAFFAARPFRDLDDLNAQFRRWRDDVAHQRRHPEQPDRTVAEVWADEKPRLLPLPAHPFETELVRVVRSGKTPYVRFDRNLYSIPHTHVRKPLTLLASDTRVRILDQQTELARHRRTYDTAQTVEDPAHLEGLLAATRQANVHTTRDRLRVAVPATAALFERLAERGEALRPHATRLLALLDDYGPKELAAAVDDALQRDALGAGSITHILETRRRQRGLKPPLRLTLPDRPRTGVGLAPVTDTGGTPPTGSGPRPRIRRSRAFGSIVTTALEASASPCPKRYPLTSVIGSQSVCTTPAGSAVVRIREASPPWNPKIACQSSPTPIRVRPRPRAPGPSASSGRARRRPGTGSRPGTRRRSRGARGAGPAGGARRRWPRGSCRRGRWCACRRVPAHSAAARRGQCAAAPRHRRAPWAAGARPGRRRTAPIQASTSSVRGPGPAAGPSPTSSAASTVQHFGSSILTPTARSRSTSTSAMPGPSPSLARCRSPKVVST